MFLLFPSLVIQEDFNYSYLDEAISLYEDDIPNPEAIKIEILTWRLRFMNQEPENIPTTIAGALKVIDKMYFPNLFELLKLVATFPITSCECERSFSTFRRLKTWFKSSMETDRLAAGPWP